ncbi:MAG: glutamine--tRNA ligase [Rhodospirillales bacterium]|nr:glutamine--tRNA ligase [Rhodospirillales bacterium]
MNENTKKHLRDFIRDKISTDLTEGINDFIVTRFPPEPNGYLHIGHAKSICLNFGVAEEFGGRCNLRFDDTNPTKEEQIYIDSIIKDVNWLGYDSESNIHYTSDYFEQLYEWATFLVNKKLAYVDDLTPEEIRNYRGTLTRPGTESPFRNRSVEENADLLERMRAGEFKDGEKSLRAKIDMASPNINLRDPVLYRILSKAHPRTGDTWKIYPMYDFAHGQSDAIEDVTHSLCTLEFEDHRPLYEWFLENLPVLSKPRQYEFSRLNLSHTVLSKRKLIKLVEDNFVLGWDDPRMPTIAGMRRRGVPPTAIKDFIERIGVTKSDGIVEMSYLDNTIREHLNQTSLRRMAVLDPLKVIIDNFPEDLEDKLEAINNPNDESAGTREISFSREIYIERSDFLEDPPNKYFRLAPGKEVRLRYAYLVTFTKVIKDSNGKILEVHCLYDPESRGGNAPDGRKVKGTIHWVSAQYSNKANVNLYKNLFNSEMPDTGEDWLDNINQDSLEVRENCYIEKCLTNATAGETVQFERLGYFCLDSSSEINNIVFNRTVSLRDTWTKKTSKVN